MRFIAPAIAAAAALAIGSQGFADASRPHFENPVLPTTTEGRTWEELNEDERNQVAAEALSPLLERIADAEGGPQGLNAVNRGYAGDTPGGSEKALGRKLTDMTVGEVLQAQRSSVYAVGGYQFIPQTLAGVVAGSDVKHHELFDEELQEELAIILIRLNRPVIWDYITGEHDNLYAAQLAFAQEWASIGHPSHGASYYAGIGGNRAKVRPGFVSTVLIEARGKLTDPEVTHAI